MDELHPFFTYYGIPPSTSPPPSRKRHFYHEELDENEEYEDIFEYKDTYKYFFGNENSPHSRRHYRETAQIPSTNLSRGSSRSHVSQPTGLVPVTEVDPSFQSMFPFDFFNPVQSRCFNTSYQSDTNMLVCAPTGSGKTVVFELAMISHLLKNTKKSAGKSKILYLAPLKALCQEKSSDWENKFGSLGYKCVEVSGDTDNDLNALKSVDIMCSTPEKWDSLTRSVRNLTSMMNSVGLVLIDEVHILQEDRGATLEAVISRMKFVGNVQSVSLRKRFIAASATCPNVNDVAGWLEVQSDSVMIFGEEFRPVPLKVNILGFPCKSSSWVFNRNLKFRLFETIRRYSEGKPTLVFCSTRKDAEQTAQQLVKDVASSQSLFIKSAEQKAKLAGIFSSIYDKTLAECIVHGIGFFHSALEPHDRKTIFQLFYDETLQVICSTSGLALGVNLPAHCVIIKGTQSYQTGVGFEEMEPLTILQMIGRAGRPQFDTSANAVLLVDESKKRKYEQLTRGQKDLESSLFGSLAEHLNSEIVLGTVCDVTQCILWLKSTFLFIRIKKNPKQYGFSEALSEQELENQLKNLCLKSLHELAAESMIKIEEDGFSLSPLEIGKAMARFCVKMGTMKQLSKLPSSPRIEDLIDALSGSSEFSSIVLRRGEKKLLNSLNGQENSVKFPIKGKISTHKNKISVLIQAACSETDIGDWSLKQDTANIFRTAPRIVRCMILFLIERKMFTGLHNALILNQSLVNKMWWDSKSVCKQIEKIGIASARTLANVGITNFQDLLKLDPRRLEALLNRHPPFGNTVLKNASKIWSNYQIEAKESEEAAKLGEVVVSLTNNSYDQFSSQRLGRNHKGRFSALLCGSLKDNIFCFSKRINNFECQKTEYSFSASGVSDLDIFLLNEDFVGMNSFFCLHLKNSPNKLPSLFPKDEIPSFSLSARAPLNSKPSEEDNGKLLIQAKLAFQQKDSTYANVQRIPPTHRPFVSTDMKAPRSGLLMATQSHAPSTQSIESFQAATDISDQELEVIEKRLLSMKSKAQRQSSPKVQHTSGYHLSNDSSPSHPREFKYQKIEGIEFKSPPTFQIQQKAVPQLNANKKPTFQLPSNPKRNYVHSDPFFELDSLIFDDD